VNDGDQKIWDAYECRSWPTLVVIDAEGNVVGRGSGEGLYEALDRVVGQLVAEAKKKGVLNDKPIRFDTAAFRDKVDSPLYFRIQTNRKKSEGIRPLGAAGTSPGGPAYELQAPIDWTTTDVTGEIGYTSRKMHLSLSYTYSKFEDANEFLFWRTPLVTNAASPNTEKSTIAPDNKLERLALNGIFRGLPLDSTLAIRGVHTKTTNSFSIFPTFLSVSAPNGFDRLANPSQPNFTGDVVNDLSALVGDPSVSIHEAKVFVCRVERA